jgi:hypothetical protein
VYQDWAPTLANDALKSADGAAKSAEGASKPADGQ